MKKTLCILCIPVVFFFSCSKPEISPHALRERRAALDSCTLGNELIDPVMFLTYQDVIQLALTRNIDILVHAEEYAIQRETATGQLLGMMPTLFATYNLDARSNTLASFSKAVSTGVVSLVQSTSTQLPERHWDFTCTWSLLDFGLSYFRSRQERDKASIVAHQTLRTRQNLILDVTKLYWKAIISKKAADDACYMINLIEQRKHDIEKEICERSISSLEGLDNERKLLEIRNSLSIFEQDLARAKSELSGLIGLRIGYCYELAEPPWEYFTPPNCMDDLVSTALLFRPELMAQDYQEKIQIDEVRVATLQMFPNARLFAGYNRDQNFFLLHEYWLAAGIHAAWDLLSLPKNLYQRFAAEGKTSLAKFQRLSLSVGVLTQVYLAYVEYIAAREKFYLSHELATVNARLLHDAKIAQIRGQYQLDDVLKIQGETLLANINALFNYADMQVALEHLSNAIGRPLSFSTLTKTYYAPDKQFPLETEPSAILRFYWDFNYHIPVEEIGEICQLPVPASTNEDTMS